MAVMRRCCCCSVKAGSVVTGTYSLIIFGLALAQWVYLYVEFEPAIKTLEERLLQTDSEETRVDIRKFIEESGGFEYLKNIVLIFIAVFSVYCLSSLLVMFTPCCESRWLHLPWLILFAIFMVFQLSNVGLLIYVLAILQINSGTFFWMLIAALALVVIFFILHMYMYVGVIGYWQVLAEKQSSRYQQQRSYNQQSHHPQQMSHNYPHKMPY